MPATIIGFCGLLIWSMSGVMAANIRNIPTFEILAITYTISFCLTMLYVAKTKRWHKLKQPWYIWLIGIVGICGSDGLYITAYKYAPPAHVDTLYYLWPIFFLILSSLFLKEKFTLKQAFAASISLLGICLLFNGNEMSLSNITNLKGYGFAIADALVCALYTIGARYYKEVPHEMVGMYCGCAMVFSLLNHAQFEVTVMPNQSEWITLVLMGITSQCIAYFLWDIGVKRGSLKVLSMLSYGGAILSMTILFVFGLAEPSVSLIAACSIVTIGIFIAMIPWNFRTVAEYLQLLPPTKPAQES
ncbi:MAG: DMT family transporter [Pseudomonadota bacterium]|nr:DMT family transporter [Pseudomonadota bacterium]